MAAVITPLPIVRLLRNLAGRCKMTCRWLHVRKIEKGIQFQYGDRFSKTGSSFTSAVDWDLSLKFGMQVDFHLLKQMPSLNLNAEVDFRHLENSIWRHNSAADHPISTIFSRQMQNDMSMTTHRSKSITEIEFQYGGRSFSETGNSFSQTPSLFQLAHNNK